MDEEKDRLSKPFHTAVRNTGLAWPDVLIPEAREAVDAGRGRLILFTGHDGLFMLGHYLMVWRLAEGERVAVVDGANVFDLPLIARLSRTLNENTRELLKRISISRAFTVHQLEAVVAGRLEEVLKARGSRVCFISGLLDTFRDEEVPLWEAVSILRRLMLRLRDLARQGYRVIVISPEPPVRPDRRKGLIPLVTRSADRVFTLRPVGAELTLVDETRAADAPRWTFSALRGSTKRPTRRP